MTELSRVRVAVNGYGVIGKRVADGVTFQPDMELVRVADIISDYRIRIALERGYPVWRRLATTSRGFGPHLPPSPRAGGWR